MTNLPIRLTNTYKEAYSKYSWKHGVEGLCVEWNMLNIAEMAGKNIEFLIKKRRTRFIISPLKAKEVSKQYGSVFTRNRDRKVIVVIPQNECERIKL